MITFTNDLKCIKHIRKDSDGDTSTEYLTYNQYRSAFVDERWRGERRTGKEYTLFGYNHTKTTVRFGTMKSTHTFVFPHSMGEAERLHAENGGN